MAGLVLTCLLAQFFDYTEAPIHKVLAASGSELPFDVVFDAVGLLDTSLYTHSAAYLKPEGTFVSTGPQPHGFDILGIIRFLWDVFLHPRFLGGTRRTWRYVSSSLRHYMRVTHPGMGLTITSRMVRVKHRREDLERICEYVAEGERSTMSSRARTAH